MFSAHERTVALIRKLRKFKLTSRRRRPARPQQPDVIRQAYFGIIRDRFLRPAQALVMRELWPEVDVELRNRKDASRLDGVNDAMDRITNQFAKQVLHPRDLEAVAANIADKTSTFQKGQIEKQARAALGVDVFRAEPNLDPVTGRFVQANVALIKSVPSQYFSDIEKTVTHGVQSGMRHEDIAKLLTERYGVAEGRAALIARDQVGKFYGKLAEVRQKSLGVTGYIWNTVHDNRVRDEHAALDGQHFEWSDPPADGHPGEAVNCRCFAEPDFSHVLEDADALEAEVDEGEETTPEEAPPEDITPDDVALESGEPLDLKPEDFAEPDVAAAPEAATAPPEEAPAYQPGDYRREPNPTMYTVAEAGKKNERIGKSGFLFKTLAEAKAYALGRERRTVIIPPKR